MSLINNDKKIYRPLAEGMYHVLFQSWREIAPPQDAPEGSEGYVQFIGKLIEDGRPITDTRYANSVNIMLSQVQQQLNLPDGMSALEIANHLTNWNPDRPLILDLYVSKNVSGDKEYTNYNYMPVVKATQTHAEVESDEAFN